MAKRMQSPTCKCGHTELAHESVGSWYDSKCIICECQQFARAWWQSIIRRPGKGKHVK